LIAVQLAFLTPTAALSIVLAAIPLAAWLVWSRRDDHARRSLHLPAPLHRVRLLPAAAIVATVALIAVAAAQPVIQHSTTRHERTDAEAYVVFDISRSMAASPAPRAPDRLARARAFALALRPRLASIPVGVASFTDRVLPHLFPTTDEGAFAAVVRQAVLVEQPPPSRFYAGRATELNTLAQFTTAAYFRPQARYRALIVLTDGESQPIAPSLADSLRRAPGIHVVFVHVWRDDDRIFPTSIPDPNYRPDPNSRAMLDRAATTLGATTVSASGIGAAAAATRDALGRGTVRPVSDTARVALMPYVTLAAFLPLGFLLWRRNL
jgi:hypothetical protein